MPVPAMRRSWLAALLVAAAVLNGLHLMYPVDLAGDTTFLLVVGGAAAVAWVGALRRPRSPSRVPLLLAIGLTISASGSLFWQFYLLFGMEPEVSVADVAYMLSYVVLGAALLSTLVEGRTGSRIDKDAVIDALTIVVVSVLVLWDVSISNSWRTRRWPRSAGWCGLPIRCWMRSCWRWLRVR